MYLIAGLGNPGPAYRNTRHNLGCEVLEAWAEGLAATWSSKRFQSMSARASYMGKSLVLLRPATFMNLSGEAIQACAHYYRIHEGHVLVVHDDLDLPLGRIRVVKGGGAGGHKGVLSITRHLGTKDFARVRIGIGRPEHRQPVEKYVLSPFSNSERVIVAQMIHLGIRACELFVVDGVDVAMNTINGQDLTTSDDD